mgnify:CR=1 FL=1
MTMEQRMHELLCAYALGETDAAQKIEVERALAASAELRAELERIEGTIGLVRETLGGGETADLCIDPSGAGRDRVKMGSFLVQRSWSATAAKTGHDPCQPVPESAPWYNVAPVTDKDDSIKLKVGQPYTFELAAYSDVPVDGGWHLQAMDLGAMMTGKDSSLTVTFQGADEIDADSLTGRRCIAALDLAQQAPVHRAHQLGRHHRATVRRRQRQALDVVQPAQRGERRARGEARAHGVSDVEVYLAAEESSLTRFANNGIHQNVSEQSRMISIRVAIGQRTARATTNRFANIREATRSAIALARASEPDANLLPLYHPAAIEPVQRWDEATANFTPQARAEAVRDAIAAVASVGHIAAGIFEPSRSSQILANSNGLFARHDETGATFSITATAADSSGWAKASAVRASDLDPVRLARSAAEKATRSAKPRRLEPGKYCVLLEPAAVLDFAGQIFADCTATALEEERSFLTGRMDQQIFGSNITIHDDVRHPLQDGAPFDGEGVPRQPLRNSQACLPARLSQKS